MLFPVFSPERSPSRSVRASDGRIAAFAYLCRRGARKFWRTGLERSDLEQVAAVGLIKAARRYDAAMETPFEAYAWLMIVGELMHHVRDHERAIRLPRRLHELERRFLRAHGALSSRLDREPSEAEIAGELGVLPQAVAELRVARANASFASIDDAPAAELAATALLDLEDRVIFDDALAALSPAERRVIAGIYLLGLTQIEIARRLGVSAKRVSRLHHAALVRMQRVLAS